MPWIIGDCDNMKYSLVIWRNNHSTRLKTQYDSIVKARKVCYEKLNKDHKIESIDILNESKNWFCGYVHRGAYKNRDKIVIDTDGNMNYTGHYIRADGSIYPTELNRWYAHFDKEKGKTKRKSKT